MQHHGKVGAKALHETVAITKAEARAKRLGDRIGSEMLAALKNTRPSTLFKVKPETPGYTLGEN